MANPLDIGNIREIKEKSNFTVSANSEETVFYDDNESGWVNEVLVRCNSANLILKIVLGAEVDSMKISDAKDYGLDKPNTSFWVPKYDTSKKIYVIAYQPFNPQPYKDSVKVALRNETATDITVTKTIFKRMIIKPEIEPTEIVPITPIT